VYGKDALLLLIQLAELLKGILDMSGLQELKRYSDDVLLF
jgi:hypothetical protein